jgi:hypothetical protein
VGAAWGPSIGYKLELPPQRNSRITKLPSTIGSKIEKIGNTYISSFCYEGCTYSLFDPNTLTTTPLERMTNAYNGRVYDRKEDLIGIDSQGRMVINVRDVPEGTQNNQETFNTTMLAAVPLGNESTTVTLIEEDKLPKKVSEFFMLNGIDKVLMLTDETVYVYDFVQNEIRGIQTVPKLKDYLYSKENSSYPSHSKTDEEVCFFDTEQDVIFTINLISESYVDPPPSDCTRPHSDKSYEELFKELNLPDNFEFIYTPLTYKTYNVVEGMPESEVPKDAEVLE